MTFNMFMYVYLYVHMNTSVYGVRSRRVLGSTCVMVGFVKVFKEIYKISVGVPIEVYRDNLNWGYASPTFTKPFA